MRNYTTLEDWLDSGDNTTSHLFKKECTLPVTHPQPSDHTRRSSYPSNDLSVGSDRATLGYGNRIYGNRRRKLYTTASRALMPPLGPVHTKPRASHERPVADFRRLRHGDGISATSSSAERASNARYTDSLHKVWSRGDCQHQKEQHRKEQHHLQHEQKLQNEQEMELPANDNTAEESEMPSSAGARDLRHAIEVEKLRLSGDVLRDLRPSTIEYVLEQVTAYCCTRARATERGSGHARVTKTITSASVAQQVARFRVHDQSSEQHPACFKFRNKPDIHTVHRLANGKKSNTRAYDDGTAPTVGLHSREQSQARDSLGSLTLTSPRPAGSTDSVWRVDRTVGRGAFGHAVLMSSDTWQDSSSISLAAAAAQAAPASRAPSTAPPLPPSVAGKGGLSVCRELALLPNLLSEGRCIFKVDLRRVSVIWEAFIHCQVKPALPCRILNHRSAIF